MINRETAIAILDAIANNPLYDDGARLALDEISYCIYAETRGLMIWGSKEQLPDFDEILNRAIENEDPKPIKEYVYGMSEFEEQEIENENSNERGTGEQELPTVPEDRTKKN